MESRFYNYKTHELNDEKIIKELKKLPTMYENGGIAEVQELCEEIADAIREFEDDYDD